MLIVRLLGRFIGARTFNGAIFSDPLSAILLDRSADHCLLRAEVETYET